MTSAEPNFLLELEAPGDRKRYLRAAVLSLVAHFVLVWAFVVGSPLIPAKPARNVPPIEIVRRVTPLIAPPTVLTQKAPNKGPLAKEFTAESLVPRPAVQQRASPGAASSPAPRGHREFSPPPQPKAAPAPSPNIKLPEAPAIEVAENKPNQIPGLGNPTALPPPVQPPTQQKPKIAFETPGAQTGNPTQTLARIQQPRPTVDDAIRGAIRDSGKGMVVGNEDESGALSSPSLRSSPMPGKLGSGLELLSDPGGVDFGPYLIRVLATVRRNWYAVIPESARLGRQGRVVIQFSISKDGSVPKLVIAVPSGADALDRAAVAGISASNPFPPLPDDFKAPIVRLQLVFRYNVPGR